MQSAETEVTHVIEAYIDDYISIAIPASQEQLVHVATAVMSGIYDVFPADTDDDEDPISLKKMKKLEAMWTLNKDILGFTFDGIEKTIWLEDSKRDAMPNNPMQVDPECTKWPSTPGMVHTVHYFFQSFYASGRNGCPNDTGAFRRTVF